VSNILEHGQPFIVRLASVATYFHAFV